MIQLLILMLGFTHAQTCVERLHTHSLRNLLERGLRSGALTPADLAPPYAANFNPLAAKTPTAQNIHLQQAFAHLPPVADVGPIITGVLRAWAARATRVDEAREHTTRVLAPRIVWRKPGLKLSSLGGTHLEVTHLNGETLVVAALSNGQGVNHYLIDLTEPARPTFKRLSLPGHFLSSLPSLTIFTAGGRRRAWQVPLNSLYDLDLPEDTPALLPHHPLEPMESIRGSVRHPTEFKVYAVSDMRGLLEFDLIHPQQAPRVLDPAPSRLEPQLTVVAGGVLLTHFDENQNLHGTFADGRAAFRPFRRKGCKARAAVVFAEDGVAKVAYIDASGGETFFKTVNLATDQQELFISLSANPERPMTLAREGDTLYALADKIGGNQPPLFGTYVVNLKTGAFKLLDSDDKSTPIEVVPVFGQTMLVWGNTRGEVVLAPLTGPSTDVSIFKVKLATVAVLNVFIQKQSVYALISGRGNELSLLEFTVPAVAP